MRNLRLKPGRVGAYFTIGWCLARFQAKHALGLDPGGESGSRQENASNRESRSLSDSIERDKALADFGILHDHFVSEALAAIAVSLSSLSRPNQPIQGIFGSLPVWPANGILLAMAACKHDAVQLREALSWRKYTSTFMPTASGPGSPRLTSTSTTSTSVMLRWPSELLRPASTSGAMKDTVPAISRSRNAAGRTNTACPSFIFSM